MHVLRATIVFFAPLLLGGCSPRAALEPATEGCVSVDAQTPGEPQATGAITVRNNLSHPVSYTIELPEGTEDRTLQPGGVERFSDRMTLRLSFRRGAELSERHLLPGQLYAFSLSTKQQVELYRQAHSRAVADLAPFVPTPMKVVGKMLELAEVTAADKVVDIGCGDGRIVIAAAKEHGAHGVGIDLDQSLIVKSRDNAKAAGVEQLVEFRQQDATKADISAATVVTMYLLPHGTIIITPVLEAQLRSGTRVVTHGFPIQPWQDRLVEAAEVLGEDHKLHKLFLYHK